MKHYYEEKIGAATAEKMRCAGLIDAAGCNFGYAFDALLERGFVICVVPKPDPDHVLNEKGVIPDIDSVKWDAWLNGTCIPAQGTWTDAAETAIEAAIATL
ncbi:MAG: hypothetical protein IJK99_09150 [Bacteroidales bacterium]|nr:hypothetical protein [Bacteroidales bacterium]